MQATTLPTRLSFDPVCAADIPIVQGLAREIWHAHFPGIISGAQIDYMLERMYATQVIEREIAAGTVWEILRQDGEAVGFLSFTRDGTEGLVKLHKLYLQVRCHGQGLGQAGLRRVMDAAGACGARRVSLYVNRHNAKAIRAYRRAGFAVAESVLTDIGGGFVLDDYRMTIELPVHPIGPLGVQQT